MSVLARSVVWATYAQQRASRAVHAAHALLEQLALHALHEEELASAGAHLYDLSPSYRGERIEPWEHAWWTARLPKAPARVLLGGCGAGRELVWLVERGYAVDAFDPARSLVKLARRRAGSRAHVRLASYRDFVSQMRAAPRDAIPQFDAIVLGWGSVSHVLSQEARRALLEACARVCPHGPILVSWLPTERPLAIESRAARVGARAGAAVRELRGLGPQQLDNTCFLPHAGPAHLFLPGEMEELARSAGLRFSMETGHPTPHATLHARHRAGPRSVDHATIELLHDVLRSGRSMRLLARGGSMSPAIADGSSLRVEPHGQLALGEVVAARVSGALLVHRVVGIDGRGRILLKGDACQEPDGWIDEDAVIGRVHAKAHGHEDVAIPLGIPSPSRARRAMLRAARAWGALHQR